MRERVEGEIDAILAPYFDALKAVIYTVRKGQPVPTELPDHRTRIRAAEAALDRAYGKPKLMADVEVSGDRREEQREAFAAAFVGPNGAEVRQRAHELVAAVGRARAKGHDSPTG